MYWLIETEEQLEYFILNPIKEAFIEIIPFNDNIHPAINDVSLIYIRPSNSTKAYMLCIDHTETFSINKTTINTLIQSIDKIWVRDKKSALYYFPFKNMCCLSPLNPTYIQSDTQAHIHFQNTDYLNINKIIPVSKHYEKCENIYNQIKHIINKPIPDYYSFYNEKVILAFFGIEKNGIKINEQQFYKHYEPNKNIYSIYDNRIYTQYNLSTTTRRPSNAFNSINFAALNKDSGARSSFIPENKFVEIDISAYHPHLAAKLIGYDFGDLDVHKAFAEMYGVSYEESKQITFRQLYGGIYKQYEHLEYFQMVKAFINKAWNEFETTGKYKVPISGYIFEFSKLENMNPQKLFNYILQNVESAVNTYILMDIHKLLRGKQTKIVLYTYDSFLFDVVEEGIEQQIQDIFKKYKLFTKTKYGTSYDFE
jgi:hypothetical protein